jgi:hypothetical protein
MVDFGHCSEFCQPLPSQKMYVRVTPPVSRLEAISGSRNFHVCLQRSKIDSARFELSVNSCANLPVGIIASQVALLSYGKDGQPFPKKVLPIKGEVLADVQASPPALLLGTKPIKQSLEDTITLMSLAGQPFHVTNVRVDSDHFTAEAIRNRAVDHREHILRVKGKVEREGAVEARIGVSVRRADGTHQDINIPIHYHGLRGSGR